jgi:hypothetical protein
MHAEIPADPSLLWALRDDPRRHSWLLVECRLTHDPDGQWVLELTRGSETVLTETCVSASGALARAEEIQQILLDAGWTNRSTA